MRFLIYGVFLAGWLAMWVWTYTCHIKKACCPGRFAQELPVGPEYPDLDKPIAFLPDNSEPVVGRRFAFYRDSLLANLDSGKVLEVTGYFTETETQQTGADRAVAVLDILASQLDGHRYSLKSRKVVQGAIEINESQFMEAYDVRIISRATGSDSVAFMESRRDF